MSDDGIATLVETRFCTVCGRDFTVTIQDDEFLPTYTQMDTQFESCGWRGYFCPSHAHLSK